MGEFHRELATAGGHGPQTADVSEHLCQRHISFDSHTGRAGHLVLDHAASAVQITDDVTHVVFRSEDINLHDRFYQLRGCFGHGLAIGAPRRKLKGHRGGVDRVKAAVKQFNFNIKYRESGDGALLHHALKALFNGRKEFFRHVTTHHGRAE